MGCPYNSVKMLVVIKMNWSRNYARGAFIADNSHEAAVIFTSALSPRIDCIFEEPVNS